MSLSAEYRFVLKPHNRICLVAFLVDFSAMASLVTLPFFVYRQLGGSVALSGWFGAGQAICYAAFCLISSRYVARAKHGLNWSLAGLALYVLFLCLTPLTRNVAACGVLSSLAIGSLAFFWPAVHSWIGASPDLDQRGRYMARLNIAWSSGFAIGPLVTGPLYEYDYRLPFVLVFAVGIAAWLLVKSMPHESAHFGNATEEAIAARATHDRASEVYLYSAWCATMVGNGLNGVTRSIYPKRIEDLASAGDLRFLFESVPSPWLNARAAVTYSWLAFTLAAFTALTFLLLGRTRFWHHRLSFIVALQAGAAAAFWVLGGTRSLLVMLACFLIVGINGGVCFFAALFYGMANPALKHRRSAINEAAVGAGGFLGSLVFAELARRYGMALPFHCTPLFVGAAIALQFALVHYGASRQRRILSSLPS